MPPSDGWIEGFIHRRTGALVRHFITRAAGVSARRTRRCCARSDCTDRPRGTGLRAFDTWFRNKAGRNAAAARRRSPRGPGVRRPPPSLVEKAAILLNAARSGDYGRSGHRNPTMSERIAPPKSCRRVLTDLGRVAFPTTHPPLEGSAGFPVPQRPFCAKRTSSEPRLARSRGTLKRGPGADPVPPCDPGLGRSCNQRLGNGTSRPATHRCLPACEPAPAVAMLLCHDLPPREMPATMTSGRSPGDGGTISVAKLAHLVRAVVTTGSHPAPAAGLERRHVVPAHPPTNRVTTGGGELVPTAWPSAPAIALKGTGRLPIAVIGDGDCTRDRTLVDGGQCAGADAV
jgi:hypothetical protein